MVLHATFSFLIKSSSKLLVTSTGIKAWTSSIFGLWFPWPIYMFLEMRFDLGTLDSSSPKGNVAHLSQRLTRWAYSIAMVHRRSSSVVVVVVHTFKPLYLSSQLTNLDQILCVASLGLGKGCIRFWGRLDQNSGFRGNIKPPLTYNGKNDVSTFSRLFLIGSFLYLQVTRTCIKSRTSSNFHEIGPLTTELAALEHLKNFP